MIPVNCKRCGKPFEIYPCFARDGLGIYCSPECFHISRRGAKFTEEQKERQRISQRNRVRIPIEEKRKQELEQYRDGKTCSKCKTLKPLQEFRNSKDGICGKVAICKTCEAIRQKEYRTRNAVKVKRAEKKYKKTNAERIRETNQIYRKNNPEKVKLWKKQYGEANREKIIQQQKDWRQRNLVEVKERRNRRHKERMTNDIQYRLNHSLNNAVNKSLRRNGGSKEGKPWEGIVGYTVQDLRAHLESLFKQGMEWLNYGEWHIDHIKPISAFLFQSYDDLEFNECWSLDNLQPLWAGENIRKSNHY